MDPTKLAGALQYNSRSGHVVGGCAKISVPNGQKASDFLETLEDVVPADQANIIAISPVAAGYPSFEIQALLEVHARNKLTEEQRLKLPPPSKGSSVFKQGNATLSALTTRQADIASFGCDGGVHGNDIIISLHSVTGPKLDIVATRTVQQLEGTLFEAFGVKLVICKKHNGKVIVGQLDTCHILKRNEEALCSGGHLLVMGPQQYCSWGFWAVCGVPVNIIVKPDAMSDELIQKAYSPAVMQMPLNNAPAAIDPTGTILMLFLVGEAIDMGLHQGFLDIERLARVAICETVLVAIRKYTETMEHGRLSNFAFHATPMGNWIKWSHALLASMLEWNADYPDQPNYPPGWGTMRLETKYGVRRDKNENFGALELSNQHLQDLAVSSLFASGELKAASSAKGYKSFEERRMHANCYVSSPRHVLLTVFSEADQVGRTLLRRKLSIAENEGKARPVEGVTPGTPLQPLVRTDDEEAAMAAEAEIDSLVVIGDEQATLEKTEATLAAAAEGDAEAEATMATDAAVDVELAAVAPAAAIAMTTEASAEVERELDEVLEATKETPLSLEPEPRGAGASAAIPCSTQREQTSSTWLVKLKEAIECNGMAAFCQALIDIRKATVEVTNGKVGTRVQTPEQAAAAIAAKDAAHTIHLEGNDGESLDPSTLLRLRRQGTAQKYAAFRKMGRLARWRAGGGEAEELTTAEESTVQSGEVWLVLDGPVHVIPAVIISPTARIGGALRVETDPKRARTRWPTL